MKKIILGVIALLSFTAMFAQMTNNSKNKNNKITTTVKPVVTKPGKTTIGTTATTKPAVTTPVKPTVTTTSTTRPVATTSLKKDGTPDMRFKENKNLHPVHLKKDGTPDMRYRENKLKNKR